jgi:hypothetical protein
MNSSSKPAESHITGSGGAAPPVSSESDPLKALDDLMAVVEELCPVRTRRDTFKNTCDIRL